MEIVSQAEVSAFSPVVLGGGSSPALIGPEETAPGDDSADMPWTSPRLDSDKSKIAWTESLKDIVRTCYDGHGKDPLLTLEEQSGLVTRVDDKATSPGDDSSTSPVKVLNTVDGTVAIVDLEEEEEREEQKMVRLEGEEAPDPGPVPMSGPIAAKDFNQFNSSDLKNKANMGSVKAPVCDSSVTEIFICCHCEKEFKDQPDLHRHQESCSAGSVESSPAESRVLRRARRRCRLKMPRYPQVEKSIFTDSLGLVASSKVDDIKTQSKDVDCEIIDVEEKPVPKTPSTPRSANSIMSQLSRDLSPPGGGAKRSISMELGQVMVSPTGNAGQLGTVSTEKLGTVSAPETKKKKVPTATLR